MLVALLASSLWVHSVAAQDIAPILLSASGNESRTPVVEQGWPLVFTVHVTNAHAFEVDVPVVTVAAEGGSWTNAIRLRATNAAGQDVSWPLHAISPPSGPLTLDGEMGGVAAWYLSPEETQSIPAGSYELGISLDSTSFAGPGSGTASVRSTPVEITVSAPSPSSPEHDARYRLLLTRYHLYLGQNDDALHAIEALLSNQPENITATALRADLLSEMGEFRAALDAYSRAYSLYDAAFPNAQEPPVSILHARNELARQIDASTSFEVTLGPKDNRHPYYGEGSPDAFLIDDIMGTELVLQRGITYTFRAHDVPEATPFYLATGPDGSAAQPYTEGVEGAPASGADAVVFTPSETTPDTLYYAGAGAENMGWRILIADPPSSTATQPEAAGPQETEYTLSGAYPNPFVASTTLELTVRQPQQVTVDVVDLLGRSVQTAYRGDVDGNELRKLTVDAAGLPSGIYFIRVKGETFQAVRKVLLVR